MLGPIKASKLEWAISPGFDDPNGGGPLKGIRPLGPGEDAIGLHEVPAGVVGVMIHCHNARKDQGSGGDFPQM